MALKTDYKAFIAPETGRRFHQTPNSDGTVTMTDVTEYTQEGDYYGPETLNTTNAKVNEIDSQLANKADMPETGSNDNGDYIKYPDGTLICAKVVVFTTTAATAAGAIFRATSSNSLGAWPLAFIDAPVTQTNLAESSGNNAWLASAAAPSAASAGGVMLYSAVSDSSNRQRTVHVLGIGRWK